MLPKKKKLKIYFKSRLLTYKDKKHNNSKVSNVKLNILMKDGKCFNQYQLYKENLNQIYIEKYKPAFSTNIIFCYLMRTIIINFFIVLF